MPALTVRDAVERQVMSTRSRCMEALLHNPALTLDNLAQLTGAHKNTIRVVTGTDEFRATLAELVQQRYQLQLAQVRSASLGNAVNAFDALNRILGEDSLAPTSQQIEAAKVSLDFTQKTSLAIAPAPTPAQGVPSQSVTVNVALSAEDLQRARNKAAIRAQELAIDAQPVPALQAPQSDGAVRLLEGGIAI